MENIGDARTSPQIKSATGDGHALLQPLQREHFKYLGRTWRVYKRAPGASASWHFLIERGGQPHATSLRTSALVAAVANAKLLIDGAQQNKLEKIRAILGGREERDTREFCRIEEYLMLYESTPTGGNTARSRHDFVLAFRRILARVGASPERMDGLGAMFKAARAVANLAVEAAAENADKMRLKRSFNSELGNAASVIGELAVYFLKDKVVLPDFTELRRQIKFLKFKEAAKLSKQFNPPTPAVMEATVKAWQELPRNEFIAVGLSLACGLRLGEIRGEWIPGEDGRKVLHGAADWSFFEEQAGHLWYCAKGNYKNKTDTLRVQVLNPFWDILMDRVRRERWNEPDLLAENNLCIRVNRSNFPKVVSAWMIGLGWETRLHLHALRAWAGSLVFMRYGIVAASSFCRHANLQVTKDSYLWLKSDWHVDGAPVQIAGRPVEWVRAVSQTIA